ncbi:MAG: hypothetical protein ABEL04_02005 [Salinibacter sp.]|uniref:hypothetical protein n=1 Tax=Salinibacter sp. TaxID=2065818 RepID=UPI0035D452C5
MPPRYDFAQAMPPSVEAIKDDSSRSGVLGSSSIIGGIAGVAGGATCVTVSLTDPAKHPTPSTLVGATSVALGTWSLVAALRNGEASLPSSPPASAHSNWSWKIVPTTITTVEGSTQPGVRARVQF